MARKTNGSKALQGLLVSQRKKLRDESKLALQNVMRAIQTNDRRVRESGMWWALRNPKSEATKLRDDARQTVAAAESFCKTRKQSAVWPGDAREDCRRERRGAGANARLLHARSAGLLATHDAARFAAVVQIEQTHVDNLGPLLGKLSNAQENRRNLREKKQPARKPGTSHQRFAKRTETRDQTIENFPQEHREFCKDNYKQVVQRAKGKRVHLHEACAEMAQESEFENQAAYLGATRKYEGTTFENELQREQAKFYGETLEAPKKIRKKLLRGMQPDLIFSLGGKPKPEKKPKAAKPAKVVDPTTATSAARRTERMFAKADDVPF